MEQLIAKSLGLFFPQGTPEGVTDPGTLLVVLLGLAGLLTYVFKGLLKVWGGFFEDFFKPRPRLVWVLVPSLAVMAVSLASARGLTALLLVPVLVLAVIWQLRWPAQGTRRRAMVTQAAALIATFFIAEVVHVVLRPSSVGEGAVYVSLGFEDLGGLTEEELVEVSRDYRAQLSGAFEGAVDIRPRADEDDAKWTSERLMALQQEDGGASPVLVLCNKVRSMECDGGTRVLTILTAPVELGEFEPYCHGEPIAGLRGANNDVPYLGLKAANAILREFKDHDSLGVGSGAADYVRKNLVSRIHQQAFVRQPDAGIVQVLSELIARERIDDEEVDAALTEFETIFHPQSCEETSRRRRRAQFASHGVTR